LKRACNLFKGFGLNGGGRFAGTGNRRFDFRRFGMYKKFWNVQIEMYTDGRVLAAVLRNREAAIMPRDVYVHNPERDVFSLWFKTESKAREAVIEALAMNKKQEAVA
jgi:hypothetical protein